MGLKNLQTEIRIRRHGLEMRARKVDRKAIAGAWSILVCCIRNERLRLPRFLGHYRSLGVAHFLIVDNGSTDGLDEYLQQQPDCSWWHAPGSYKASNFGMDWCNHLLAKFGVGKWCVTVDPDEFLLFPYCETRGLRSLTRYMEGIEQASLFAPLMDVYGPHSLSQTHLTPESDPFEICPYYDRFNLTQKFNEDNRNFWVQGGPRMRRFFPENPGKAPALNKVPLVKWRKGLRYVSSMHHLNDPALNCTLLDNTPAVSGVLFHFKYVSLLTAKASEELTRGEHYDGSAEYKAYLDAGDPVLYDPGVSLRFGGTEALCEQGFMQKGYWF